MDPIIIKISSHKTCLMRDNPHLFSLQLFPNKGCEIVSFDFDIGFKMVEG